MKLKLSETGLVEGGIECGFATFHTLKTPEKVTVFDLVDWVNRQFSEIRALAEKRGKKGWGEDRYIWIGDTKMPFARIASNLSTFQAEYYHPKFITRVGFFSIREKFESPNVETITADVISRALRVENLEG